MTKQFSKFWQDFTSHPIQWAALFIMATLTYHAIYYFTQNVIFAFGAIILAEGGAKYWEGRFRFAENEAQNITAVLGMSLSIIAAAVTDAASAAILASETGVFDMFREVPQWAQLVVTFVTAVMAIIQSVMVIIYRWLADTDAQIREKMREINKLTIESQNALKIARINADLDIQRAAAEEVARIALINARTEGATRAAAEWEELIKTAHSGKNAKTPQPGGDVNFPNGR